MSEAPAATPRDRVRSILAGIAGPSGGTAGSPGSTSAYVPLLLAPMATLTHAGLRTLISEHGGPDLYWSEMISAEALVGGTPYEKSYLNEDPAPDRLIFQLVGYTRERIVEAAKRLAVTGAAGMDFNMGCSAPHIVRKGGGIAWMREPRETVRLLEELRALLPDRSLSVKLRLGRTDDPDELLALCRRIQSTGVDFITLHPKRQKEGSARRARWRYVAFLREELSIPVVGNGGVTGYETLQSRLARAGAGPVMIGRAAVRAPWIFAYLRSRLSGEAAEYRVSLDLVAERFFTLLERYQPHDFQPTRARRFVPYLVSNLAFGHSLGARISGMREYEEVRDAVMGYFVKHPDARLHVERD